MIFQYTQKKLKFGNSKSFQIHTRQLSLWNLTIFQNGYAKILDF
jgi:hypothetical protein